MALVTREGFQGWVGGSCTRPTVVEEARLALADGLPRLVSLDPDPESQRRRRLTVHLMACHSVGGFARHGLKVLDRHFRR
jgi:xanthine dehydrogenase accessory factor